MATDRLGYYHVCQYGNPEPTPTAGDFCLLSVYILVHVLFSFL